MLAISVKELRRINSARQQDHDDFRDAFLELMHLFGRVRFSPQSMLCIPKYWSSWVCGAVEIMMSIDPEIKFDVIEERHGGLHMEYITVSEKYDIIKDLVAQVQGRIDTEVQVRIKEHSREHKDAHMS